MNQCTELSTAQHGNLVSFQNCIFIFLPLGIFLNIQLQIQFTFWIKKEFDGLLSKVPAFRTKRIMSETCSTCVSDWTCSNDVLSGFFSHCCCYYITRSTKNVKRTSEREWLNDLRKYWEMEWKKRKTFQVNTCIELFTSDALKSLILFILRIESI